MQGGTPSVTTSIGAESMHGNLTWNGFIEDNPELFANQAVTLYSDEKVWLEAQKSGFKIISQRYIRTLFETKFTAHIQFLQDNLPQHRLLNFVGALLQHHTLKSTKYMSKWIEAKNKS